MTWLAETAMLAYGWRRFALLLIAGAVAGLSIPPLFFLPALFIAMPVWIWALDGTAPQGGWRRVFGSAFGIGFAFGWGYFLVAFHWLGAAFFVDGGIMLVLMVPAILALAALIALFWGLASSLAHALWSHSGWRILTLATALSAAEWTRGHVLTGFPFDLLGYALTPTAEMMQLSAVIGVYGLTFLAALLAMTPALIWPADERPLTQRLTPFFAAIAILAAQLGYGYNRLQGATTAPIEDMRMRLVQPLVYEHSNWSSANPEALIERLITLSQMQASPEDPGLAAVTHLVWPESALPFYLERYPESLARIGRMLGPEQILLTGAPRISYSGAPDQPPFNSVLAIDQSGAAVASYDKAHLVPFGEFLPYQSFFAELGIKQFVPGANGWQPGDPRQRVMALPFGPTLLVLICYEILFSGDLGETEDAELLFNITNDAWFDGSIGPAQHAHHARVRAVEEGMSLVRAANSGITFATDPFGRITGQLPARQMDVLDVTPMQRLEATPFTQVRHWPFLAAMLVGGLASVYAAIRHGVRPRRHQRH
ncbi:apolipoprotein N-acyltransferase [Devosia pacifica]|uniref:Apolipoprotein N-acyltransferase n=1 Tax=Devosia pacifica TaxID=1335967 RepID=A0A918VSP8_9HYPH|nr:apolipoprotein N-acyltransferase [Devosia pacifica]GHA20860.1 apolipoprotein N-acyltransferase [Devosia pacifica]